MPDTHAAGTLIMPAHHDELAGMTDDMGSVAGRLFWCEWFGWPAMAP